MVDRETKPQTDRNLWRQLVAGAMALFIAMGVGRFAYTPILPLMQAQAHVTNSLAGFLASSNYFGYLVGAFAAGSVTWFRRCRLRVYRWSLWINIVTTGEMAATGNHWIWYILRVLSGVTSGFVFVLVSSIVLDELANRRRSRLSGVFYGGVGCGIVVTGLAVPMFENVAGWRGAWFGLMILTLVIGIPAVLWMKDAQDGSPTTTSQTTEHPRKLSPPRTYFSWLVVAYGLEGLGYIITGTFLVSLAVAIPGLQRFAAYSWIVVGAAAIPSCFIWAYVAQRWGNISALILPPPFG
ncbi:MAG: YbfB/YjiJ family MFS transporter [Alicyclobacillus sp.]|nr:YbfB/YjiJ family MFS transporter [Alicyclobacillus sp.]